MDNIEKLREKLEKDPSSTLFVPLAEEYKKAGMLDEAIKVLKDGIEKKPAYMSARVSLGKVYLEKGMKQEAAEELLKVVSAIPDNLYAHKKLAEIYRDQNDIPRAKEEFKTVLALNAKDEEAKAALAELEEGAARAREAQAAPAEKAPVKPVEEVEELGIDLSPVQAEEPAPVEDVDSEDFVLSIADRDALDEPGQESAKAPEEAKPLAREYNEEPSIRQPLSGAEAEAAAFWMPEDDGEDWKIGSAPPAETPVDEASSEGLDMGGETPPPVEAVEEEMMEFPGLGDEVEEETPEAEETLQAVAEEPIPEVEETPQAMEEIVPEGEETVQEAEETFAAVAEEPAPEAGEAPQPVEEIALEVEDTVQEMVEEATPEVDDTLQPVEKVEEIVPEVEETPPMAEETFLELGDAANEAGGALHRADAPHNGGSDGLSRADECINSGEYGRAMGIYRKLLAENPDDRAALQKVEELKALLRLLGRDSDVLIGKLESFLGEIKRRKDEFFKNP